MRSNLFGILLVTFGFLFLLDNLGMIEFGDFMHRFWPLILILIGLSLIFRSRNKPHDVTQQAQQPSYQSATIPPPQPQTHQTYSQPSYATSNVDMLNVSEVFGELRLDIVSQNFRGGRVSNVFGEVRIDLTKTILADGDSVIDISAVFGDIVLLVPREMAFSIQANVSVGDIRVFDMKRDGLFCKLNYKTANLDSSPKRLHIVTSSVFGECKVW